MAKKKKTQLKTVDRGFATTSVPKKVVPAEEEARTQAAVEESQPEQSASAGEVKENLPSSSAENAPVEDEFDPDKVEEQSLQNLVDKLQEKTEKEITR